MSAPFVAPRGIARLLSDWATGFPEAMNRQGMPAAGALVRLDQRPRYRGAPLFAHTGMDGAGFSRQPADLDLDHHPALTWRDFETLLSFYFHRGARLPNLKPMDTVKGLNAIASGGSLSAYARIAIVDIPGNASNWGAWARAFLGYTQGGHLTGSGYLIAYNRPGDPSPPPQIWRFMLCDHSFVAGRGRPERGWRPGHCSRCGLDMSVDSSD